jgi:two-component system, NtrC family, response regulator PilR
MSMWMPLPVCASAHDHDNLFRAPMNPPSHFSLLVVDDEPDLRTLYELTLLREGYDIETAGTVEDAKLHLKDRVYSAVITDMRLPDGTGLELLRWLEDNGRREKAIVITAYGSAENAVEALKAGAYDYLTKPVDLKQFRAVVASSLGRGPATVPTMVPSSLPSSLPSPSAAARPEPVLNQAAAVAAVVSAARANKVAPPAAADIPESAALRRMAGDSPGMQQVRELIEKVARSMAPVLVSGESGTGKELVARAIHEVSPRHAQPFIAVNCSAIPEQLLEAEFFGYRKGAFTGAMEDREGFFQAANGGTLFLDEIGELPLSMQSKLLRAIQERSVRPVGAMNELAVNVRLLSATHKDLGAEVQAGQFRQDLYYRLNVIQICVPPLRERTADLRLISERVLERIARDAYVSPAPTLTRDALVHLARYPFPGNVRELENLLHRAVALTGGELIDVFDLGLPESVFTDTAAQELDLITSNTRFDMTSLDALAAAVPIQVSASFAASESPLPDDLALYLDDVERDILVRSLERFRYNRTAAGASLGLSLRQMRYRMARLNVTVGGDAFDV